jgi:toxin-antitoxin system PIN domain toxin
MIVPDINLLVYTYDSESPFHAKATRWWQGCLSGADPVGLAEPVVFGFLRITTNARVFRSPLTVAMAASHVRSWLEEPVVQVLHPSDAHIERVLGALEKLGTGGNLVTGSQIAALAMEYKGTVHTADSDFIRFGGLHWFNPITGARFKA